MVGHGRTRHVGIGWEDMSTMTCWMTWIVRMSPRCHYEIRVRNGSLWFRMTRVSLATNLMERRVCFGMWLHVRTCWFKFQGWPPMSEIFSKKTCLFSHDSIVWWCLKGRIAAWCSCIMLMCSLNLVHDVWCGCSGKKCLTYWNVFSFCRQPHHVMQLPR